MVKEIGIENADLLAFAGHKYAFDNGVLESISELEDDDLDGLIAALRGYQDFDRIIMLNPALALNKARRIVETYQATATVKELEPLEAVESVPTETEEESTEQEKQSA